MHGQRASSGALPSLYAATETKLQGKGWQYIGPNQVGGWAGWALRQSFAKVQLVGGCGLIPGLQLPSLGWWLLHPALCWK